MTKIKQSSADRICDLIIDDILSGRLVPGQRLIEADLTASLGVSRGPVREAFRRLDALGIIEGSAHRGVEIKKHTRTDAIFLLEAITPTACYIAKFAADVVKNTTSTKTYNQYKKELFPYTDDGSDPGNELLSRRRFYDVLIEIGGNTQVATILPTIRIQLLRLQTFSYNKKEELQIHHENYRKIAQSILDGKPSVAEKSMSDHMKHMVSTIKGLPDSAFKPVSEASPEKRLSTIQASV